MLGGQCQCGACRIKRMRAEQAAKRRAEQYADRLAAAFGTTFNLDPSRMPSEYETRVHQAEKAIEKRKFNEWRESN